MVKYQWNQYLGKKVVITLHSDKVLRGTLDRLFMDEDSSGVRYYRYYVKTSRGIIKPFLTCDVKELEVK